MDVANLTTDIISIFSYLGGTPAIVMTLIGLALAGSAIYRLFRKFFPKITIKPKAPKPPQELLQAKDEKDSQEGGAKPGQQGTKKGSWTARLKENWGKLSFPEKVKVRRISLADLQETFYQNLGLLQQHGNGKKARYETPWFLAVGETGVGKSTLLANNGLPLALSTPTQYHDPEHSKGCDWWFYNDGIVLDVTGDCVLYEDSKTGRWVSDDHGWRALLKLLAKERPQRPIDGLILTIPATDLLAQDQLPELLKQKGEALYQKLVQAQKILGMRFPVYILLTQCDHIEGFQNFCQLLPERMLKDIFGWSNPYALDRVYDGRLVEDAFRKIYRDLNELQVELVTDKSNIPDNDLFLLFPHELRPVFMQLKHYLDQIFKASVYHESFYFRGIYCCGDSGQNQSLTDYGLESSDYTASDELGFQADTQQSLQYHPSPVFLTRLFQDKLFAEAGLATPVQQAHRSRSRHLLLLQTSLGLVIVGGIASQWYAFNKLAEEKKSLYPVLENIKRDELRLREVESEVNMDKGYFSELNRLEQESALNLLNGMAEISTDGINSLLIPASWFSDVEQRTIDSLSVAYSRFVSKWLRNGLVRKSQQLIVVSENGPVADEEMGDSIETINEFIRLRAYLDQLQELQAHTEIYNRLREDGQVSTRLSSLIKGMGNLVSYLYGVQLPSNFYNNSRLYSEAIRRAHYEDFALSAFQKSANYRLNELQEDFFQRIFLANGLLKQVRELDKTLDNLSQTHRHTEWFDILTQLNKDINHAEEYIATPEHLWVISPQFDLGTGFGQLLSDIKDFSLFGPGERDQFLQTGKEQFATFREELLGYDSELVGPILLEGRDNAANTEDEDDAKTTGKASKNLVIARGVVHLKQLLGSFLKKDFMAAVPAPRPLIVELPLSKRLIWDNARLQNAVKLVENFQHFVDNELVEMPETLQAIALRAGHYQLHENMREQVARAQKIESQSSEVGAEFERKLSADVANFREAAELLNWLLQALEVLKEAEDYQERFAETYKDIETISVLQAHRALAKVNKLLEQDDLYSPAQTDYFADWDANSSQLGFVVFGVSDQTELEYYLGVQRDRVQFLAQNFAQPILSFMAGKELPASFGQSSILPRWTRIYQELYKYDNENPDNSVAMLEKFIQFGLNKIRPENCYSQLYQTDFGQPSGDYFLQKRADLQFELFKQCEAKQNFLMEVDLEDKLDLKTEFSVGQNLFWDIDLLREAVRQAEKFTEFAEKELPELPEEQQAIARDNGYAQFHANIIDQIARAQFIDSHLWLRGSDFEEGLQSEVQNFSEASQILNWFIQFFERVADSENDHQESFSQSAQELSAVGSLQAFRLLGHTNTLLDEDELYKPREGFVNWDAKEKLSTLAYGPHDKPEMEHYLSTQRDRVTALVSQFADPLLSFLAEKTPPPESGYNEVIPRWTRIYTELFNYNNAKPDNTVATLEEFIRFEMDKLSEQNCYSQLYAAGLNDTSGDYFIQKKIALLQTIFQGCSQASGYLATDIEQDGKRQLETRLPLGQALLWDVEGLEKALKKAEAFGHFVETELPLLPQEQQDIARNSGYLQFHIDLIDLIARAQRIETLKAASLEKRVQENVKNFRDAAPRLSWFIEFFDRVGNAETPHQATFLQSRDALNNLGITQAYRLLAQTDKLLLEDMLYRPGQDLETWDGKEKLTILAFGAEKPPELQFYLATQRDRVIHMAQNYAQPLLTFLADKPIPAQYGLQDVIPRWTRIYQELFKYENEKPDNTLAQLENFILTRMNRVNLSNCYEKLAHGGLGQPTGDYFLDRKEQLALTVYLRCQYIADMEAFKRYHVLQDFFNQHLAGRFPFAPLSNARFFDEADPEDIQNFFLLFNQYGENLQDYFSKTASFGSDREKVVLWLDQIARVQVFMDSLLEQSLPLESSLYQVIVDFRVNQANEKGANQIIGWQLDKRNSSDNVTLNGQPLKGKRPNLVENREGSWHFADVWHYGEALRFALRWARNSAYRPYYDGIQKNFRLGGNDDTAVFEFNGKWALLELLMRHKGTPNDFDSFEDAQPYTLKFSVPIKRLLPARRQAEPPPLRKMETAPPPQPAPECYMDWYEESFGDSRCLQEGYKKAQSSKNQFHAAGKDDDSLLFGRRHNSTFPLMSEQDAPYPGRQLPNGELAPEDVRKYEARYSEEFEENSEAVVFIRLTLTFPNQNQRLIVPEFPYNAPKLKGIAAKLRRHSSNMAVFKTLLPPDDMPGQIELPPPPQPSTQEAAPPAPANPVPPPAPIAQGES